MGSSVKVVDHGLAKTIDLVEELTASMTFGVGGEEAKAQHPRSKLTVGELAAVHEFGAGNVPERSIVRGYVDEHSRDVARRARELAERVVRQRISAREMRFLLGEFVVQGMQRRMDEGIEPWLLPETLNDKERVGPPVPLEDTLTLRDALGYSWKEPQK